MTTRNFRNSLLSYSAMASVAMAAATSASWVQAQGRVSVLEEIIVTARKTEESIQDAPISIAAFGQSDLEKIGVSEAKAIANYTPNLRMQKQSASQDNYAMAIRGVSSGESALAVEPTVGIYQDGVYIARSTGAAFDIMDLQRIEVLRGPQGTLFGRNTIGGAINIITEKPRGELAYKQQVSVGDDDYLKFQGSVDTPQFGDFSFKLSYMYLEKDGDFTSIYNGGELGGREAEAFRFAGRWQATEDITVDLVYDKSDRESNSSTTQLNSVRDVYANPASPTYGGPIYQQAQAAASPDRLSKLYLTNTDADEQSSDIDGTSLTVEWEMNPDTTFKSITSYREWKSEANGTAFGEFRADGATLIDITTFTPVPAGELVSLFSAMRESAQHQFTQEFQLVGSLMNERLFYNTGLYYFEEKADESNPQRFILPGPVIGAGGPGASFWLNSPNFAYATDNASWALYGQFTYSVTDALDVTLGLRYTIDDKETTLTNTLDGSLQTVTDDESWSNFSPSLTVDYEWTPDMSTYAKVTTGYRSGGYNVRASSVATFQDPVDEENVVSYELGLKADWFDSTLRTNAAVFYIDYTDRQIAQFVAGSGGASTTIVNAGESTTAGLELDVTWVPVTGLQLTLAYGFLDLEYEEFITNNVDIETGFPIPGPLPGGNTDIADFANTDLYAPEHSGAFIVDYAFEPFDFGVLSLRVDTTFVDSISFHPLYTADSAEEYWLLNARATLADIPMGDKGSMRVSLWGTNLEDKEYRDFGIDFGSLGFAVSNWGERRAFGMDFIYEFNR